jgi:hypothetical protein
MVNNQKFLDNFKRTIGIGILGLSGLTVSVLGGCASVPENVDVYNRVEVPSRSKYSFSTLDEGNREKFIKGSLNAWYQNCLEPMFWGITTLNYDTFVRGW